MSSTFLSKNLECKDFFLSALLYEDVIGEIRNEVRHLCSSGFTNEGPKIAV